MQWIPCSWSLLIVVKYTDLRCIKGYFVCFRALQKVPSVIYFLLRHSLLCLSFFAQIVWVSSLILWFGHDLLFHLCIPVNLYTLCLSICFCLFLLSILSSKSFMCAYVSSTTCSGFFLFKIQHHSFKEEGPTLRKDLISGGDSSTHWQELCRSGNWTFQVLSLEDTSLDLVGVWDPFLGYPTLYTLYAVSMGSLKARPTSDLRSTGQAYWFSSPMANWPEVMKLVQLNQLLYVNWLIRAFLTKFFWTITYSTGKCAGSSAGTLHGVKHFDNSPAGTWHHPAIFTAAAPACSVSSVLC